MPEMNNREMLVQVFRIAVASAAGKIDDAVEAFRRFVYTEKGLDDNISVISGTPDDYNDLPSLVPVTQSTEFWHKFMKSSVAEVARTADAVATEDDDEMPPLISLATAAVGAQSQHIDLVISETEQEATQSQTQSQSQSQSQPKAQRTPSVSSSLGENEVGDDEEAEGSDAEGSEDEAEATDAEEGSEEEAEAEEEGSEAEAEAEEEEEEEAEAEEEAEPEAEEIELNLEPVRIKKVIYWKDSDSGDLYAYLPEDEVGDKVGSYVNGKPVFD